MKKIKIDRIGNPYIDKNIETNTTAKKVGYYKGNTIYDKGKNSNFEYRFYMRGKPNKGFNRGMVTANGHDIKNLKWDFNKP